LPSYLPLEKIRQDGALNFSLQTWEQVEGKGWRVFRRGARCGRERGGVSLYTPSRSFPYKITTQVMLHILSFLSRIMGAR